MEIFTFNGYDGEKIALKLKEVIGFPDSTSYEGGYDIICSLEIDVGCYKAKFDRYYSATGALYSFSNQLKECYERLEGEARYALLLENDFIFTGFIEDVKLILFILESPFVFLKIPQNKICY